MLKVYLYISVFEKVEFLTTISLAFYEFLVLCAVYIHILQSLLRISSPIVGLRGKYSRTKNDGQLILTSLRTIFCNFFVAPTQEGLMCWGVPVAHLGS